MASQRLPCTSRMKPNAQILLVIVCKCQQLFRLDSASKGLHPEQVSRRRSAGRREKIKAGIIGTGNVGNPMAKNLLAAGVELVVNDVRQEACADRAPGTGSEA